MHIHTATPAVAVSEPESMWLPDSGGEMPIAVAKITKLEGVASSAPGSAKSKYPGNLAPD